MKTIKENKLKLLLVSLITLLPIAEGAFLWDKLPDMMPTHWGPTGEVDGYASKPVAVILMPILMYILFWVCVVFSDKVNANGKKQNAKAEQLVLWIIPVISVIINTMSYAVALGMGINVGLVFSLLFGFMFVLLGNYMPKVVQNRTLGIKIKWTLENEANWNATHRFAGKLWFFGGFAIILMAFLPEKILFPCFFAVTLVLVAVPVIYSWRFSKKENKDEDN